MSRTTIAAQLLAQGVIEGARESLVTERDYTQVVTEKRQPTLKQLVKLLTDPHSEFMVDRHEKYTARLTSFMANRGGVLLSELVELFKVIELIVRLCRGGEVYTS